VTVRYRDDGRQERLPSVNSLAGCCRKFAEWTQNETSNIEHPTSNAQCGDANAWVLVGCWVLDACLARQRSWVLDVYPSAMSKAERISYGIMAVLLVLIAWLHLGALALTALFGYFRTPAFSALAAASCWAW